MPEVGCRDTAPRRPSESAHRPTDFRRREFAALRRVVLLMGAATGRWSLARGSRAAVIAGMAATWLAAGPALAAVGVRPAERKVAAIAGRPLVIPLAPADLDRSRPLPNDWMPDAEPVATFVTGERLESALYRLSVAVPDPRAPRGWLPPAGEWRASTLGEVRASRATEDDPLARPGYWALLIDLPLGARGRELRLDGRAIPIAWVNPPPASTDLRRAPRPRASPDAVRALWSMLEGEAADPLRRWRAAVIADRLPPPPGFRSPGRRNEPRIISALADQNEWRWRAAIASLARASPDASADLLARLTAIPLMPEGHLLPCWPLNESEALRLRAALLDPQVSPDSALDLTRAFVRSTPPAVAWLVDDTAAGGTVRIGVSDLTGRRTTFAITTEGGTPGEPVTVEGHESAILTLDPPPADAAIQFAEVRAAGWVGRVAYRRAPMPARPPGLAIQPFASEWFMESWMRGTPAGASADWAVAAVLHRPNPQGPWEVYVECRLPPGTSPPQDDVVRLRLGRRGGGASGSPGGAAQTIIIKPTRLASDRWTANVAIPDDATDSDGIILMSVERETAGRPRLTWPLPLLPGMDSSPPARIDLTAWGDLED